MPAGRRREPSRRPTTTPPRRAGSAKPKFPGGHSVSITPRSCATTSAGSTPANAAAFSRGRPEGGLATIFLVKRLSQRWVDSVVGGGTAVVVEGRANLRALVSAACQRLYRSTAFERRWETSLSRFASCAWPLATRWAT